MHMPAQQREAARNYIDLLSDAAVRRRAAKEQAAIDLRIRDHAIGTMDAMFRRGSQTLGLDAAGKAGHQKLRWARNSS